jgi:serine/threonine-protein kinase HipA
MNDKLLVKVDNSISGSLVEENGEFIFSYSCEDKSKFISLTMPVRVKGYINHTLHPIFEMHLPEGYLLSIIKKHFSKLVKTDDFGLLKLMSPNINGRVTYDNSEKKSENFLTINDLLNPKSKNLFNELVTKFALTSSLSGVQPKVLAKVQDKATLHLEDYIVKSWGDDYPELALNEYYCMKIAEYSGVAVPEFYISSDDKLFIMKRFDIKGDKKLGFEDMCVLQVKQRDDKYEGSYERIAKSVKTFVSTKYKRESLVQFYKMIVINNLVKNGDAHLKNFGLLYEDIENIKLSPAYDIVCTKLYIKNDISALNLLGSKKWWDKKYLIRFGIENCNLSKSDATAFYDECLSALNKVKKDITIRLDAEKDKQKKIFLENLLEIFEENFK